MTTTAEFERALVLVFEGVVRRGWWCRTPRFGGVTQLHHVCSRERELPECATATRDHAPAALLRTPNVPQCTEVVLDILMECPVCGCSRMRSRLLSQTWRVRPSHSAVRPRPPHPLCVHALPTPQLRCVAGFPPLSCLVAGPLQGCSHSASHDVCGNSGKSRGRQCRGRSAPQRVYPAAPRRNPCPGDACVCVCVRA